MAHKKENRSRKRAIDQLHNKSKRSNRKHISSQINDDLNTEEKEQLIANGEMRDDFSDDGYSSLDGGESYLDYDTRTDVSDFINEN